MSRELQTLNGQNKLALWSSRISECRNSGQNVKTWCRENEICEQTYYKWQRRVFEMAKAQKEVSFAEVTPLQAVRSSEVAVTVRISGTDRLRRCDLRKGCFVCCLLFRQRLKQPPLPIVIGFLRQSVFLAPGPDRHTAAAAGHDPGYPIL